MALLDLYKSEHKPGHCPPMSPRISFSNDFVDACQILKQERRSDAPPASTDFEFSVSNSSMMSGADELFFKGRLLPYRDGGGGSGSQGQRTIRDALLVDDDGDEVSRRPPKSSTRWKGLLGLKRSHIGSKKVDKSSHEVGSMERACDSTNNGYVHEEVHGNKTSQEILSEGGSSCRDVEFGI